MSTQKVIPIVAGSARVVPVFAPPLADLGHGAMSGLLQDRRGRPLHDLRISVTDRCNFRCSYCMPKEVFDKNHRYLPHQSLLSFEEILRLAKLFVAHGVQKIRLTGGEPLLRKDIEVLVHMLAQLRTPSGQALDLTLTTNGSLLAKKAAALKQAGLNRVTVSLDALDDGVFKAMNDVDFPVKSVLEGIEAARQVGLASTPGALKINMVVKKGVNDDQILPMARFFRGQGVSLRFIEYMDVGTTNGWRMDEVVPSAQVLGILQKEFRLAPSHRLQKGETAERWAYVDHTGQPDPSLGEIGLISSVSKAFCQDCNRARLSTEGKLFLCLFADQGFDLKPLLREPSDTATQDQRIAQWIAAIWQQRTDNYSETRALGQAATQVRQRIEMSYIGG